MKRCLVWDVTNKCNLRCTHCYNADKYFNESVILSELSTVQALELIHKVKKEDFYGILFLGGEPFARKDFFTLLHEMDKLNLISHITTNGTLFNDEIIEQLLQLRFLGNFSCSIDGCSSETNDAVRGLGSFQKAVHGISALANKKKQNKHSAQLWLSYTITNKNLHEIIQIPVLAKTLGVDFVNIALLYEEGNAKKNNYKYNNKEMIFEIDKLISQIFSSEDNIKYHIEVRPRFINYWLQKYSSKLGDKLIVNPGFSHCSAGEELIYVEADGTVHPCHATNATRGETCRQNNLIKLENLNWNRKSISEIENSDYFSSFLTLKKLSRDKQKNLSICKDCSMKEFCDLCPIVYSNTKTVAECEFCKQLELSLYESFLEFIPKKIKDLSDLSKDCVAENFIKEIDEEKTFQDILEKMLTMYEVSKERLLFDFGKILLDLQRHNYIKCDKFVGDYL